jgi:hypothetical protein
VFDLADVPQLRGVADKLTPAHSIGGAFGTRTELGAGLSHGGAFPTVQALLLAAHPSQAGAPAFDLSPEEADAIAAFLSAFDTGLAPSTGYQATAHAGNAAGFAAAELDYLTREAEKGHCDLIFRGAPQSSGGATLWPSGLYDPGTGAFRVASAGAPQVTIAALLADAAAGRPVTFIGVPLWMGLPLALDRDVDELYDLDELAAGTNPEHADTDRDTFPDGYELRFGMDPLAPDAGSPDAEIPRLVGQPRLVYATTNTLKLELQTSEACQLVVSHGGKAVDRLPLHPDFDVLFSVIVGELEPDTDHALELTLIDPAGNQGLETVSYRTAPLAFPAPVRVDDIALAILPAAGAAGADRLEATVELSTGMQPPAPGYLVSADVHYEASFGALTPVATGVQELLGASDGTLVFGIDLPAPQPAPGRVHFVVRAIAPPPGQPPYARALNGETWDAVSWN